MAAVTDKEKVEQARRFVERMRIMSIEEIAEIMVKECGDNLTMFMLEYAAGAMARDPTIANAQSLMVMGYLIRADQDRSNIFQGSALA